MNSLSESSVLKGNVSSRDLSSYQWILLSIWDTSFKGGRNPLSRDVSSRDLSYYHRINLLIWDSISFKVDKNPLIKGSFLKGIVLFTKGQPRDLSLSSDHLLIWDISFKGDRIPLIKGSFLKGSVLFTNGQPRDLYLSSDHLSKGLSSRDLSFLLMVKPRITYQRVFPQ